MKAINVSLPVLIDTYAIATMPSDQGFAAQFPRVRDDLQEKILWLAGIRVPRGEILVNQVNYTCNQQGPLRGPPCSTKGQL
jgi:hypothetical protein